MNYNMYPNRMGDNIDPNYIYPQPYIDPLMYMNPYYNNQNMNFNSSPSPNPEYNTYSNQYFPYLFPSTLRIYSFFCKDSIIRFTVLRDFPVSAASSFCLMDGFL